MVVLPCLGTFDPVAVRTQELVGTTDAVDHILIDLRWRTERSTFFCSIAFHVVDLKSTGIRETATATLIAENGESGIPVFLVYLGRTGPPVVFILLVPPGLLSA